VYHQKDVTLGSMFRRLAKPRFPHFFSFDGRH
jgi:hypothetical protein